MTRRIMTVAAVARGDTLMTALLDLWVVRNRPGLDLGCVYPER